MDTDLIFILKEYIAWNLKSMSNHYMCWNDSNMITNENMVNSQRQLGFII